MIRGKLHPQKYNAQHLGLPGLENPPEEQETHRRRVSSVLCCNRKETAKGRAKQEVSTCREGSEKQADKHLDGKVRI